MLCARAPADLSRLSSSLSPPRTQEDQVAADEESVARLREQLQESEGRLRAADEKAEQTAAALRDLATKLDQLKVRAGLRACVRACPPACLRACLPAGVRGAQDRTRHDMTRQRAKHGRRERKRIS